MPLRHFAPAKSASRLLPQPGGFEGSRGLRKNRSRAKRPSRNSNTQAILAHKLVPLRVRNPLSERTLFAWFSAQKRAICGEIA